jgi:hypothetical protein
MLKKIAKAILLREMRQMERRVERLPRSAEGWVQATPAQIEELAWQYSHIYAMYRTIGGTETEVLKFMPLSRRG